MDDRTIRNEEVFKKLQIALDEAHAKIDFAKVEAEHSSLMDEALGVCPIS